jgi:glycosyltransferase involved in cell wall biosynthesis
MKWSSYTRHFLKFSEFLSTKFADVIIFVSFYQKEKLGNKLNFIHINNGVNLPSPSNKDNYIKDLGLIPRKYILSVGRFVEEKGFDLLIRAFSKTKQKGIQLVIAGDSDHETSYSFHLKELAKANGVVLPGFIKGENLSQLYNNARLFVLSSYNEGQPLSLLEAMSYHLPVLASDIPATLQVNLPGESYFTSGNELSLQEKLDQKLSSDFESVNYDMAPYNWDNIAIQTKNVYKQLMERRGRSKSGS